jgi:hypothetical protein
MIGRNSMSDMWKVSSIVGRALPLRTYSLRRDTPAFGSGTPVLNRPIGQLASRYLERLAQKGESEPIAPVSEAAT